MALSFNPKFNPDDIRKQLEKKKEAIIKAIIVRLQKLGEEFIKNARIMGEYTDQTGNLRSSIGYVILNNGEQILDSFPGDKEEGVRTGRKVASDAAKKFPKGIVLIVVAGMGYAAAVESKNYDVLTSSAILAETALIKSINELKQKLAA